MSDVTCAIQQKASELDAMKAILKRFQMHDYLHWRHSDGGAMISLDFHAYPLGTYQQKEILLDLYLRLIDITQDDRDAIEQELISQIACTKRNIISLAIGITTKEERK